MRLEPIKFPDVTRNSARRVQTERKGAQNTGELRKDEQGKKGEDVCFRSLFFAPFSSRSLRLASFLVPVSFYLLILRSLRLCLRGTGSNHIEMDPARKSDPTGLLNWSGAIQSDPELDLPIFRSSFESVWIRTGPVPDGSM